MTTKISEELLNLHESLLRAQLNVIRQYRKESGLENNDEPADKGMSQMDVVYDILSETNKPMHVDDIIDIAEKRFDKKFDKESIVSAITKRVSRQDRFIKTAPNTFFLISKSQERERS
jgi:hypothetical protein